MRLIGTAHVRNEADVVEAFVRHNLSVLDAIAIVDHGSLDATPDILRQLVDEGLPIFVGHEATLAFDHQMLSNRLVRHVFATSDADWVLPIDADEFLKTPSRALVEEALAALTALPCVSLEWRTYVPRFDAEDADLLAHLRLARRVRDDGHGLRKTVVSRQFAARADLYLTKGNHRVEAQDPSLRPPRAVLPADTLALAHVPVRSARQFTRKIAVAGLASLGVPVRERNESIHLREAFRYLASGRPLTRGQLEAFAVNYSVPMERWLPADAHVLEDDPFLADFTLEYVRDGDVDPLALVLRQAERMIRPAPPP